LKVRKDLEKEDLPSPEKKKSIKQYFRISGEVIKKYNLSDPVFLGTELSGPLIPALRSFLVISPGGRVIKKLISR